MVGSGFINIYLSLRQELTKGNFRVADSSETIRKTPRLGWNFFLSAVCFMISGVVLFRLNIAEKSFA
jgi:hypothetical protein